MKKLLSALLVSAMVVSLAGCGGSSSSSSSSAASSTPSSASAASEEAVELTAIVAGLTEDSPSGVALKRFAELCNEYSDGSVEVDCFFNTELGSVASCVESMVQGTIDICSTGT